MDGTDRHSCPSARARAHACADVTGAAASSVPGSQDIVTTGESQSRSALTGAGASPGANLASNDRAAHSRTGSPRSADRNRFITSPWPGWMRTSCVVPSLITWLFPSRPHQDRRTGSTRPRRQKQCDERLGRPRRLHPGPARRNRSEPAQQNPASAWPFTGSPVQTGLTLNPATVDIRPRPWTSSKRGRAETRRAQRRRTGSGTGAGYRVLTTIARLPVQQYQRRLDA